MITEYEKSTKKDHTPLKNALLEVLASEEQQGGRDIREDTPTQNGLLLALKKRVGKGFSILRSSGFIYEIYSLKVMKQVEVHAGYQREEEVFRECGLPITIQSKFSYSWQELKHWVTSPDTAVRIHVPRHAVVVFALSEEKNTGKYRHALIGRISGGQ